MCRRWIFFPDDYINLFAEHATWFLGLYLLGAILFRFSAFLHRISSHRLLGVILLHPTRSLILVLV